MFALYKVMTSLGELVSTVLLNGAALSGVVGPIFTGVAGGFAHLLRTFEGLKGNKPAAVQTERILRIETVEV
jgi:hypothetical protein